MSNLRIATGAFRMVINRRATVNNSHLSPNGLTRTSNNNSINRIRLTARRIRIRTVGATTNRTLRTMLLNRPHLLHTIRRRTTTLQTNSILIHLRARQRRIPHHPSTLPLPTKTRYLNNVLSSTRTVFTHSAMRTIRIRQRTNRMRQSGYLNT